MNIETIWQQYSSNLRGLLLAKISDPHDVDDLLQEVLIKTHQHIGQLKSREKLKPWLFRIAHNTVIDFYRRRGRQIDLTEDDLWYGEEAAALNMSDCVLPFIDALPPETAQLLKAIDIEGRSQKLYAAELGISYSTLKSRVQRGRAQLRALFEDCCHLEFDRQGNVLEYVARSGSCKSC
ncbi:RNA polymerase sigma factor SigZ [Marinobacterium jannaschii]|uniref:RNA polymerase sigma factor SigZ n=1 Tax=Marinobacterium jannaschii TaxID=64970 RepID=UPI00047F5BFD|nr:RNA polymerase sigma factor SigZ [Marinobacterium jannaschii]